MATDNVQQHRRAFIRTYQLRIGVIVCIMYPSVLTYLELDPTTKQTLISFGFRFTVGLIAFVPLSYYFLGRAWDKHFGTSEK